jgi:hypothetical protein
MLRRFRVVDAVRVAEGRQELNTVIIFHLVQIPKNENTVGDWLLVEWRLGSDHFFLLGPLRPF